MASEQVGAGAPGSVHGRNSLDWNDSGGLHGEQARLTRAALSRSGTVSPPTRPHGSGRVLGGAAKGPANMCCEVT